MAVRLVDREPEFRHVGEHTESKCYLIFRCPCTAECKHKIAIPFTPDLQGNECPELVRAQAWKRESGTTFADLTLSPSIWLHATDWDHHPGWHGFLRNGNLETC